MRWIAVWQRNFLVWRKLFIASVLTNLADPLIMLLGLGYGLGALLPSIAGMSYLQFFAAGTLCSATMMTSEETMDLLSSVRLGVNLGLIEDITIPTVNELFIQTQPAFLQKIQGTELDADSRNVARADYLRNRLANGRHKAGE